MPRGHRIEGGDKAMRHSRTGGASKMRAENIKQWLRRIIDDEDNGNERAGDK